MEKPMMDGTFHGATCLVCRGAAQFDPAADAVRVHRGNCPTCGIYELTFEAGAAISNPRHAPDLALLSAFIRQSTDLGRVAHIAADSWAAIVTEMKARPVAEKIRRTLRAVGSATSVAGDWLRADPDSDFKRRLQRQAGATNDVELDFILSALVRSGELTTDANEFVLENGWNMSGLSMQVTPNGWSVLQGESGGVQGTCFVAMSFDSALDPVYQGAMEPAISACELEVVRLDRVQHNDNINDRIMADIRRSEVLVADFTHHKGGVYFEAGFALGLDRTVVFTCRRDEFADGRGVHFDTRPYNHLLWDADNLQEFKSNLIARLQNTVPSLKRRR